MRLMRQFFYIVVSLLVSSSALVAEEPTASAQVEYVQWLSSYEEGLKKAKETGKPILLEFRCVP